MLTIRKTALALSGFYLLLLFAGIVASRLLWFYPKEIETVRHSQQQEIASITGLVSQYLNQQLTMTVDYAEWDDTYEYVDSASDDYRNTNLIADTFINLGLSGSVIMNKSGRIISAHHLNDDQSLHNGSNPVSQWLSEVYKDDLIDTITGTAGLYQIGQRVYVISLAETTNSAGNAPANGYFVFARIIEDSFWQNFREIIPVAFDVSHAMPEGCLPETSAVESFQPTVIRCFYNLFDEPVLAFSVTTAEERIPPLMPAEVYFTYLVVAGIPSLLYFVFLRLVTEPLRRATAHMEHSIISPLPELNSFPQFKVRELDELRSKFNHLIERVRSQQYELMRLSMTDKLTGIGNRRAFEEKLQETWRRALRHEDSVALILVDIDYFKRFNDHYGHQAGDLALQRVATALAGCALRQDEYAFRYGGEEFILICYTKDANELNTLRQRITDAIANLEIEHQGSKVAKHLTVSFGVAWILKSGEWLKKRSTEEWIKAADAALYEAKAAGRNNNMLQIISADVAFTGTPVLDQSPPAP